MANETAPANPLPVDFIPDGSVASHKVADGEDWASVAAQYNVAVNDLIYFNFHTNVPEEVNWYLRRNVGCNVSNDGGLNWAFSSSATPGIIYIPPAAVINMDPQDVAVDTRTTMQRLQAIAKTIDGNPGIRIRKMMDIAAQVGSPGDEHLWYYNGLAVLHYIQFQTNNADRATMTQATNGQLPFDGSAGVNYGDWKITPFRDIIVLDATTPQQDSDLKTWLLSLDTQIYTSWQDMARVEASTSLGGASGYGPLVSAFFEHIHALGDVTYHLYYVYQHDD